MLVLDLFEHEKWFWDKFEYGSSVMEKKISCSKSILQVGAEVPIDSEEADEENRSENGKTLLFVFERGYHDFWASCILTQLCPGYIFQHILVYVAATYS